MQNNTITNEKRMAKIRMFVFLSFWSSSVPLILADMYGEGCINPVAAELILK